MKEVNLSGIATVVNNIDGQPFVFKTLTLAEKRIVKKIAGRYPKWWDSKRNRFKKNQVTIGTNEWKQKIQFS